jgi:hypothetical protein
MMHSDRKQTREGMADFGDVSQRERFRQLNEKHHYLKSDVLVGEQLRYVAEV